MDSIYSDRKLKRMHELGEEENKRILKAFLYSAIIFSVVAIVLMIIYWNKLPSEVDYSVQISGHVNVDVPVELFASNSATLHFSDDWSDLEASCPSGRLDCIVEIPVVIDGSEHTVQVEVEDRLPWLARRSLYNVEVSKQEGLNLGILVSKAPLLSFEMAKLTTVLALALFVFFWVVVLSWAMAIRRSD